ncbi:MAG: hypothetical protein QOJ03_2887, partial [Frankiaceae bacterium]|nr:hypothetical protein [Frankiaceae bacterium]
MLAALALAAAVAAGPAPHRAVYVGEGFDGCQPPPTATMRAWLGSPYRAMNIYLGGKELATPCKPTAELNSQWVKTVTANGWSLIPTFVDLQPPCTRSTKKTFTASTARAAGRDAAGRAVDKMKLLGLGAGNPIYDDFEHYDESKAGCVAAAVDFVEAWTNRIHALGYTAGMYAVRDAGVAPIA